MITSSYRDGNPKQSCTVFDCKQIVQTKKHILFEKTGNLPEKKENRPIWWEHESRSLFKNQTELE